jgi:putative tryptophan/tyrosine transport system substrate-binding protein
MTIGVGRRKFISALGGVAVGFSWAPRRGRSQTPLKPLRIGLVHPVSPKGVPPNYVEFVDRLRELGYVEGDTLAIEYINLEGHVERYDEAMRDLVQRRVDLIFALGQEANLRAAMAATSTIPIVMLAISYDPLAKGYVSSLARPTGNVTGIYVLSIEATKKRLQLFKDAFPGQHAAFGFWDFESAETWKFAAEAAPSLGIALAGAELRGTPYDYESGFQQVAPDFRGSLFMPNSAAFVADAQRLAAFALRHRVTSCFESQPAFVNAGGLLSYGADLLAAARRAAEFADRIARGAKPSDLPVEQSTRFTLSINLKTAKTLGIIFPPTFLATADEVIE